MTTEPTPGPWFRARDIGVDDCTVRAVDPGCTFGRIVADVIEPDDARLIAAAPDLLTILKTIALHAPSLDAQGIRELCDEAIAKAEGPT